MSGIYTEVRLYGSARSWYEKKVPRLSDKERGYIQDVFNLMKFNQDPRALPESKRIDGELWELRLMRFNLSQRLFFVVREHNGKLVVVFRSIHKSVQGSTPAEIKATRKALKGLDLDNGFIRV